MTKFIPMNKFFYILPALLLWSCNSHSHEGEDHDHDHAKASVILSDHDNEEEHADGEIVLQPERAEQFGVKTTVATISPVSNAIHVTGEVVTDPSNNGIVVAPTSGKVMFRNGIHEGVKVGKGQTIASVSGSTVTGGDAETAARIRLNSARKELDRLTPLREKGIITATEYNTAKEAYELAQNAVTPNGNNASSPIAGTITQLNVTNGEFVEAGQPIASVMKDGSMIVRADIPKRFASTTTKATGALIKSPMDGSSVEGKIVAAPTGLSTDKGYQPLYLSIGNHEGFNPGDFVEVWISSVSAHQGIVVPIEALVERLGTKFLYVKLDEECYERRPVTVSSSDGANVEILSGLNEGEEVVTSGTTFVRLAETATVAPEGHHHH